MPDRIVEATLDVLSRQGYESTSIKEVAKAAGVAPGLVHCYFASEEKLLIAAARKASDRLHAWMTRRRASPQRAMRARLEALAQDPTGCVLRYELFAPDGYPQLARNLAGRAGGAVRVVRAVPVGQREKAHRDRRPARKSAVRAGRPATREAAPGATREFAVRAGRPWTREAAPGATRKSAVRAGRPALKGRPRRFARVPAALQPGLRVYRHRDTGSGRDSLFLSR